MKLVVFDLDFTLWDCGGTWCDCLCPPFRQEGERILDSRSREVVLYPDVLSILERLSIQSVPMALASRTERPDWALELIQMLGIVDYFDYKEIYPSSKVRHFNALKKDSGYEYAEMLFFDDEMRNIREVGDLGVTCIYLPAGLNYQSFQDGLRQVNQQ